MAPDAPDAGDAMTDYDAEWRCGIWRSPAFDNYDGGVRNAEAIWAPSADVAVLRYAAAMAKRGYALAPHVAIGVRLWWARGPWEYWRVTHLGGDDYAAVRVP